MAERTKSYALYCPLPCVSESTVVGIRLWDLDFSGSRSSLALQP